MERRVKPTEKNYRFGSKDTWRRWQWNRVTERLTRARISTANAIVFGMFGPDAIDVECALSRGFKKHNLFCIERNTETAMRLRRGGVNTLPLDFAEALDSWGDDPKIDVVIADFCGGLTQKRYHDITALDQSWAIHKSTVVSVNLLRGRDDHALFVAGLGNEYLDSLLRFDLFGGARDIGINRAVTMLKSLVSREILSMVQAASHMDTQFRLTSRQMTSIEAAIEDQIYRRAMSIKPSFYTYGSGQLRFDSAVFHMPGSEVERSDVEEFVKSTGTNEELLKMDLSKRSAFGVRAASAAKAVRTVRARALT